MFPRSLYPASLHAPPLFPPEAHGPPPPPFCLKGVTIVVVGEGAPIVVVVRSR